MGKVLDHLQGEIAKPQKLQKGLANLSISPLDVSSIEKASFFDNEEVLSFGNPLHSTALEDDFSPNQGQKVAAAEAGAEGGRAARAKTPQRARGMDEDRAPKRPPAQRKSLGVKSSSRALQRVSEGPEFDVPASRRRQVSSSAHVSGEESAEGSNSSPAAQEPPPKRTKGVRVRAAPALPKKKGSIQPKGFASSLGKETGGSWSPGSGGSGTSASGTAGQPAASSNTATPRRQRRPSLSEEELSDEDPSWHNEAGRPSVPWEEEQRKRKSSPGSSGDAGPFNKNKQRQRDVRNPNDLDVVLDAFLGFVSQYRETIDSGPVRQAIDAVSDQFEDQLTELITKTKELSSLKRGNVKVNNTINKKRSRLLEIKSELITKEAKLKRLQKEQGQLQERLTDLRKGTAFLSALEDLQRKYQAHRQSHPAQEVVYGPSSVPALLLEARGVLGAERQLKSINESLQQALDCDN